MHYLGCLKDERFVRPRSAVGPIGRASCGALWATACDLLGELSTALPIIIVELSSLFSFRSSVKNLASQEDKLRRQVFITACQLKHKIRLVLLIG
jgi:hypothetical protein